MSSFRNRFPRPAALLAAMGLLLTLCSCHREQTEPSGSSSEADSSSQVIQSSDSSSPPDYTSPIDFSSLQAQNSDIYAWLEIPDSDLSYPILRRAGDDAYYLKHNSEGDYDPKGAVFSEDYNDMDFEDPVTLLYGHNTRGAVFETLQQQFSDRSFFDAHRTLKIYLPDRELEYTIFAAVPYSNVHILYYYDFTNERVFRAFFRDVLSVRDLEAITDTGLVPDSSQHVVILSTCLAGNINRRYLILAVR